VGNPGPNIGQLKSGAQTVYTHIAGYYVVDNKAHFGNLTGSWTFFLRLANLTLASSPGSGEDDNNNKK
jgi:hypothetical protein